MTVTADENPIYDANPGNDTMDKVFLLSCDEMYDYFDNGPAECWFTDYSFAQTGYKTDDKCCDWWLRTTGQTSNTAVFVEEDGTIETCMGEDVDMKKAVRPALWINLKS